MVRREQFVNNISTTLSSGINNSTTTIPLTSSTGFPTEGDYRIIINDEIMLVKSVSGSNATAVRGQEGTAATTHSSLDEVKIIITDDGFDDWMSDHLAFSSQRNPYRLVDSNDDAITLSDFTEVNNTASDAIADQGRHITITKDDSASNDLTAIVRTAPSTPYTVTMAATGLPIADASSNGPVLGACFRENATGELMVIRLFPGAANDITVTTFTNPTTFGTTKQTYELASHTFPFWFRLEDDGVDIKFHISQDGVNFVELFSEARGTSFTSTPDEVGFFFDNVNGVDDNYASLLSWYEA